MANPLSDKIQQFLQWEAASRDCIEVKRSYVKVAGDLVAGVLLSQIIYWNLPGKDGKTKLRVSKEGKYWIAKTREEWSMECCISVYQFDRAVELLARKGLIEAKRFRFNNAPTTHIWLNIPVLIDAISKIPDFRLSINSEKSKLEKLQNLNLEKVEEHELGESRSSLTETTTENTTKTTILPTFDSGETSEPEKRGDDTDEGIQMDTSPTPINPMDPKVTSLYEHIVACVTHLNGSKPVLISWQGDCRYYLAKFLEHDSQEKVLDIINFYFKYLSENGKTFTWAFFRDDYDNIKARMEGRIQSARTNTNANHYGANASKRRQYSGPPLR
jgi:hypothetical protein